VLRERRTHERQVRPRQHAGRRGLDDDARRRLGERVHQGELDLLARLAGQRGQRGHPHGTGIATRHEPGRVHTPVRARHEPVDHSARDRLAARVERSRRELDLLPHLDRRGRRDDLDLCDRKSGGRGRLLQQG
jgi:hypothetical protein